MRQSENGAKPQISADVRKVFTDAATSFPHDFANQAQHIVAAHRPAGLPEHFQPTMNLSDWDRIQRERQRQRQEAESRERAQQQQAEQQRLAQQRAEQQREQQRKIREAESGEESCSRLDQEMRSTPLPQIAESIKQQWQAQSPNVPVTMTPIREPDVFIWTYPSESIEDKSRVGIKLSYSHQDLEKYASQSHYEGEDYISIPAIEGVGTVQEELIIGIGFTNSRTIPEAYKSGYVKAYFVETSGLVGPPEARHHAPAVHMIAVPVDYSNSLQKFYELLDDRVNDLAPSKVIPEANLRIQASGIKAHEEPKKGFWKRLIGG